MSSPPAAATDEPRLTPAQQAELDRAFDAVMAKPGDTQANLNYARLAEKYGQVRKALATYERISFNDPSNTEARAGYQRLKVALEPPATRFLLALGFQYETNAGAANSQISPALSTVQQKAKADGMATASLRMDDDRQFGDLRWRTRASIYSELHVKHQSFDFDYFGLETGPLWVLDNGWSVRVGPAAEVGFQGYDYLYYSAGATAEIEFPQPGTLRRVRFGVMRADFTRQENTRDGFILGARAELGWDNVMLQGDSIVFEPFSTWYLAQGGNHQDRYWQVGATLSYVVPVAEQTIGFRKIYLVPYVTAAYRPYAGRESLPPDVDKGDRTDWQLNPGIRLVGTYLFDRDITGVLGYDFDRLKSNYESYSYHNHRFAAHMIFGF